MTAKPNTTQNPIVTKSEAARQNGKKGGRPRKDRSASGLSAAKSTPDQKPRRGRKPGVPNKATSEVKRLCQAIINDKEYRASFTKRFKAGELAPPLEAMVWHYGYGRPAESVAVTGEDGGPVVVRFVEA